MAALRFVGYPHYGGASSKLQLSGYYCGIIPTVMEQTALNFIRTQEAVRNCFTITFQGSQGSKQDMALEWLLIGLYAPMPLEDHKVSCQDSNQMGLRHFPVWPTQIHKGCQSTLEQPFLYNFQMIQHFNQKDYPLPHCTEVAINGYLFIN